METWLNDPSAMSRAALPWVSPTLLRPKICLPQNHNSMDNCLYLIMYKHFCSCNVNFCCDLCFYLVIFMYNVFCFATSKVHDVHFKTTSQRLEKCDFCFETMINNVVLLCLLVQYCQFHTNSLFNVAIIDAFFCIFFCIFR